MLKTAKKTPLEHMDRKRFYLIGFEQSLIKSG